MRLKPPAFLVSLILTLVLPGVVQTATAMGYATLSLHGPRTIDTEARMLVSVRSAPRMIVTFQAQFAGQVYTRTHRTGQHGRTAFTYYVPFSTHAGTLQVTVRTVVAGHPLMVSRHVRVHPFVPSVGISSMQVLHQTSGEWTPTMQVHAGEQIRVTAGYGVSELAGNFFPPCVHGTVLVARSGTHILSAPVQCPAAQPLNGLPYVYIELPITSAFGLGSIDVEFDLSYPEGKYGVAHGSQSTSFSVIP